MLIGGVFALMAMATVGSAMVNYAWREAQWEEVRAAVRGAISAAGPLLSGAGDPAINLKIANRVAAFAAASLPGFNVESGDVTVTHDSATGITTVGVSGAYAFSDLWEMGNASGNQSVDSERVTVSIKSKLDAESYEVGVALDISYSMNRKIPSGEGGVQIVKLDGLKTAMRSVADAMQSATDTTPGSLLVSLVPFGSAVKVADTAGGGSSPTPGKERYVRLLAGAPAPGKTIADTLSTARAAARQGWGHWVDGFHQYGVGDDLGPLRKRTLPRRLLNNRNWNLRRTDRSVDVSDQVPGLGAWVVNDEDFWNGCVMARWGAYWDPRARPAGWTPAQASNWPATRAVDGWSGNSRSLPGTTPLHLSDAPPDASDRNTLFTAYSWPDARIGGHADHRLQTIMATLLEAPEEPKVGIQTMLRNHPTQGDNTWSAQGSQRGAALCPPNAITPLTDNLASVRQAVNNLQTVCLFPQCDGVGNASAGATYLHLGVVWALRTLSPLWQQVWHTRDLRGAARPRVPCAPNEADGNCDSRLNKSILIVSDGANWPGILGGSRLAKNSWFFNWQDPVCDGQQRFITKYHSAATESTPANFNGHFKAYLNGGKFGGAGAEDVLDAFRILDRWPDDSARRDSRKALLTKLTPWQLFRGLDAEVTDALMDGANEFGFERRPVQTEHFCRPYSFFSPYGRIDDHVYVGHSTTLPSTPLPPVEDAAPFHLEGMRRSLYTDQRNLYPSGRLGALMANRLDEWLTESCRIAGQRRVRINAIYIGQTNHTSAINALERCVDAAGGDPDKADVFVTPDAEALKTAFEDLFTIRRNLRFLD